MYMDLRERNTASIAQRVVFPHDMVWKTDLPMNIKFIFWTLLLGRTLTRVRLVNTGADIDAVCPLCECIQESISHLFLHCSLVLQLWSELLASQQVMLLKLYSVDSVQEWLLAWPSGAGNALTAKVWRYLPYAE
ncbi:hypothetical protein FRX31_023288 [Thalictrum thalictroides]|uniref:Reverse transcriptase zinc-binding domain-containing protein n=1 Tax=Thalictrum thalictroides TaxID=46969 RepID=A0A7J6VSJ7_THATH|nr:hypothetical protein FRX31_023288 [Thalictrum thalictroides]